MSRNGSYILGDSVICHFKNVSITENLPLRHVIEWTWTLMPWVFGLLKVLSVLKIYGFMRNISEKRLSHHIAMFVFIEEVKLCWGV